MCDVSCIVLLSMSVDFFFFFKQKTAYEVRISDWSSDVCSSDLGASGHRRQALPGARQQQKWSERIQQSHQADSGCYGGADGNARAALDASRSSADSCDRTPAPGRQA